MDLDKAIKGRRSIRKFSDKKVDEKTIKLIIEAGIWAPSACNFQDWKFIVLDNKKLINKIIDLGGSVVIGNAPVGILVLYNNQTDNLEYLDYIQSASACIQNMLLKIYSLRLGGCWLCHLPDKKDLRKLLKIPNHYDPIAYIALGYPLVQPKPNKRKAPLQELIFYNRFNFITKKKDNLRLIFRRMLRRLYFKIPLSIKKILRSDLFFF